MSKIMLVEDDNNLREIYEARLLAEGYEIVSAEDGEQALALAVKEKPDLIISDVMMPKISGFDMLDILRSTPETKNTKVIMMTALSQAEDKARANKLGADRYLVKSQVTLEDVAKVAREVLQDENPSPAAPAPAPAPSEPAAPAAQTAPADSATATEPPAQPIAVAPPPADDNTSDDASAQDNQTTGDQGGSPTASPKAEPNQASAAIPVAPAPEVISNTPPPAQATASAAAPAVEPAPAPPASTTVAPAVTEAPSSVPAPNPTASQLMGQTASTAPMPSAPPAPAPEPAATATAADATNAAAHTAADMAQAVNELLRKEDGKQATDTAPKADEPMAGNQIAGKKVIQPINDISVADKPDLNELLAKETGSAPEAPAAPAEASPAPPASDTPANMNAPGNVITPAGANDPNSIAL